MRLFKMSLTLQMAVATLLGIVCGLFFGDLCNIFGPYGSAYIMVLKITAVPYLIAAIMHGVGQLTVSQAKQILFRGILFICATWLINVIVIYAIYFLFPTSQSTQLGGYVSSDVPSLDFASLLIPDNIFNDLSSNIVPAIVIFSLLVGIALMYLKEKQVMLKGMENLVEVLTRITAWIARITPFGTFLIIANQVGTIQFSTVKQVSTYIILYILGTCVVIFWIFPRLINTLTTIPAYKWLQQMTPILVLAYTTNMVIVCLPYIIELLKKETQILDPQDDRAQNQIQGTVSVIFNLPLGSLFITAFVFFVSVFYNAPLNIGSQIELFVTTFLTSLGAVGLGSWINSMTFILDSLGLPVEAVNLYLTTLPFTSGFQSMVSAMEVASLSLLITLSCRDRIHFKWMRVIKKTLIAVVPLLVLFIGLKGFNPLPQIKNQLKSIYELDISSSIPVKVNKETPAAPQQVQRDTFDQILSSKVLRVGYSPSSAPFCFYNVDGNVIGYDIAFAYELAYDLGVSLELVPLTYENLSSELNSRLYDIAMSSVTINADRLKTIAFTKVYQSPRLVLVVLEKMRKKFATLEAINENKKIKIAVFRGSSFESAAKEFFPDKELIYIENYEDFHAYDENTALLWEEFEAIAWTLCHRDYRIIFPTPQLGVDTLGYAIRPYNPRFLNYMNQWLELKKAQGFTDKQFDLWIKGKTEIAAQPEPRWSVIRNVLHWID